MRRLLFLIVVVLLIVTFPACRENEANNNTNSITNMTSTEDTSVEITAEPAVGTDLSVDEIVGLYNDTILNAQRVTRVYSHAEYTNLDLSSDTIEAAARSVLDKTIKNDDSEYTSTQKSEIESILPKPCLDKAMIKSYTNTDGEISLVLHDIENPADEGCIKLYPMSFISEMLSENSLSVENMNMTYTGCRIDFTFDSENKSVTDLSYSWSVHANGSFELLFNTQNFGIDINVGESYKF